MMRVQEDTYRWPSFTRYGLDVAGGRFLGSIPEESGYEYVTSSDLAPPRGGNEGPVGSVKTAIVVPIAESVGPAPM